MAKRINEEKNDILNFQTNP